MQNLLPPEFQRNPWPMYALMRATQPVWYFQPLDIWCVFRYDDVRTVLSDWSRFSSQFSGYVTSDPAAQVRGFGDGLGPTLLTTDPPRHTQLRSLVNRAFTPKAVAALEPRIEAITRELLERVLPDGRMDVIRDLAYPLPVMIIAELLGIPPEDRDRFKHWSDEVVAASNTVLGEVNPAFPQVQAEMFAYFREVLQERRRRPGPDLISALLAVEEADRRLTEAEILGFCWLLLVAGNETTTNLIGNAVLSLLEHPQELARLQADPGLLPSAIEEALRYRSPVQAMFRVAKESVELAGRTIPAGARVVAFIGSANRDEARFPAPDRFDVAREPNPHIAFGHGPHFCLGAPLARLEARIALDQLLRRTQNWALAPDAQLEPCRGFIVHGVTSLPVTFTPRPS